MITKNQTTKLLPARPDGTSEPPMRLATPREACAYGRFSHTKLYEYINQGKVDAYKRDTRTFINLDSIDRMHAAMPKIEPRDVAAPRPDHARRSRR
jgi:hypothetical protein